MKSKNKLFLYSMNVSFRQCERLTKLVGKEPNDITIGIIENATDIIEGDTGWQGSFREMLSINGYRLEQIDLRLWYDDPKELEKKLSEKDVIWLGGGHTYYLRWILKRSGADAIISKLVNKGAVYAGWSAGAIMAGPTTLFFNEMGDDPADAPGMIAEGLSLTDWVVVPHRDHEDFKKRAAKTNELLQKAGFTTVLMGDQEALVINGDQYTVI
jgi:dipeptidase E